MPLFPSREWCEAVIEAVHADPDSARAGKGWRGDVAAAVLADAGLREPFAIYARPVEGRITEFRVLEDLDEIEEIEPAYVVQATYGAWKGLMRGTLDPVQAVLEKRVQMKGDLQQIIERAQFKELVWRALGKVETVFADEAAAGRRS